MCTCILKEHIILFYFVSEYLEIHIIKRSALEILTLVLISNGGNNGITSSNMPPKLSSWFSGKEFSCQFRRHSSIPESSGRSPRRENDKPLQYSCL